jgi:hypothetical protein
MRLRAAYCTTGPLVGLSTCSQPYYKRTRHFVPDPLQPRPRGRPSNSWRSGKLRALAPAPRRKRASRLYSSSMYRCSIREISMSPGSMWRASDCSYGLRSLSSEFEQRVVKIQVLHMLWRNAEDRYAEIATFNRWRPVVEIYRAFFRFDDQLLG